MSGPRATTAWIALGSNLGRRGDALARLRTELTRTGDVIMEAASREMLTRPVGSPPQPDFHNQVVRLRASAPLTPERWLELCQAAETRAGRRPTYRWGPRRADADILLFGERGEVHTAGDHPAVPHPRLRERHFLLALLGEIGGPQIPMGSGSPGVGVGGGGGGGAGVGVGAGVGCAGGDGGGGV